MPVVDDGMVTIRFSAVIRTADGVCLGSGFERVDRAVADEVRQQREAATVVQYESLISRGVLVPACEGPDAAPTVDLSRALAFAGEVVGRLPRPSPSLPPGYALAGLRMYLVNDQALVHEETQDVDLGGVIVPVTVTATGTWSVQWGDGTGDGPFDAPSVGYQQPGLQVTKVWTDRGRYEVRVVDTWRVTVSAPGVGTLTLPAQTLAAVPLDVEVREVQAVRER
ncbi:MAG: hypothetical protein ACLGIR_04400 [Actinomycetes bacterium]